MSRLTRRWMISVVAALLAAPALGMGGAESQTPAAPVMVRGSVFVGGYFYDTAFGPYPWWPEGYYRHGYVPVFDVGAVLRLKATPDDAAVYVDGFYAGLVDDFDGASQGLPLPPGGHRLRLYRPGYRAEGHNIYLGVGSTFALRAALEPIGPWEQSEFPPAADRVPTPPPGSFRVPVVRWPNSTAAASLDARAVQTPAGWLDVRVRPSGATVTIDGERWLTSDPEHVVVDLPEGTHRVIIVAPGFVSADFDVEILDDDQQSISVSLVPAT